MNEIMKFILTLAALAFLRFLNSKIDFERKKTPLVETAIKQA